MSPVPINRRLFIRNAGLFAASTLLAGRALKGQSTDEIVTLPFQNGERDLIAYPEKRPLIRFSARPPQLETPFEVFNQGIITPNDAFFVRYHLAGIPTRIDPENYRIRVRGHVGRELNLSLAELKSLFEPVELIAVNQCSGNSRGFFSPRVGGGQLGNGAMGNARWTGVPLNRVLAKAGVASGARQVTFQGLDRPVLPTTPEFVKALDIDHALDGEVMLAYAMNGEDLPMLNGFPVRLVVPGYYGTYWVKHLADIKVIDETFEGFWMKTAYRIPDNPTHSVHPGESPKHTVPIGRYAIRSFITNLKDGDRVPAGRETGVRGIAFDGGFGIRSVDISADGGQSWGRTVLGADFGRYSFREWRAVLPPLPPGRYTLKVRAVGQTGETQPIEARWNPSGYMRNVVEAVSINAV